MTKPHRRRQRILCLCQGGNVRSVHAAYVLKYGYNVDALAASWEKNSPDTLNVLYRWADRIMLVEDHHIEHVPASFRKKVVNLGIGPDRWAALNRDLINVVTNSLARLT